MFRSYNKAVFFCGITTTGPGRVTLTTWPIQRDTNTHLYIKNSEYKQKYNFPINLFHHLNGLKLYLYPCILSFYPPPL